MKFVTAEEAVAVIKSKDRVFIHSVAAAPQRLIKAMTGRAHELRGVEVVHLHTEGDAPYSRPEHAQSFHTNALFIGANVRDAVATGEADYTPVFLSEVPALFRRRILPLDVALIHVSPPDRHGYCSLGVSVDATRAAVQAACLVVAQVNARMPRTATVCCTWARSITPSKRTTPRPSYLRTA
jgi:acyl-CoA hydrolase